MPLTMSAFLLGSLSIIGLPPFGGAWSKWLLALGAASTEHPWLVAVLMISSLLNVAYLLPIPIRAFYCPLSAEDARLKEAPGFCVAPLCLTAAGSFVLFLYANDIYRILLPITSMSP